jgi:hypothetical protein
MGHESSLLFLYFSFLVALIQPLGGPRWRRWLRHCVTNRKGAGSIPDGVVGIFHWHNPFGRTMALGSTQPLTEMSTRNISCGGKGGRSVGLTTLPPSSADYLEIWTPKRLQACNGIALPFTLLQLLVLLIITVIIIIIINKTARVMPQECSILWTP